VEEQQAPAVGAPFTKPSFIETIGLEFVQIDENRLFQAAVDYVSLYLRPSATMAVVRRFADAKDMVVSAVSDPALTVLAGEVVSGGNELLTSIFAGRQALSIPDISTSSLGYSWPDLSSKVANVGFKSLVVAPIDTLGVLVMCGRESFAFSHYDEAVMTSLALQVAFIFDGRRALAEAQRAAKLNEEILDMGSRLVGNLDSDSVLRELLNEVVHLVGADAGSLMLLEKATGRLVVKAGIGIAQEGLAASIEVGEGIAGWVAKTGKPIVISDAAGLGPELPDSELRSTLSLPIKSGESVIGVVNLGKRGQEARFEPHAASSAARLLSKAAIAMENAQAAAAMRDLYIETVRAFTQVVETKDPYSRGHSEHVTVYSMAVAEALALGEDETESLRVAAMMHDVGYAGVSDSIFRGSRPLTTVERILVNTHPVIASEVLKKIPLLSNVVPLILHHHENYDGSGYVSGLKGDEIPLGSRILAVADAFDAMTSERSYRSALSLEQAIVELRRSAGKQFDPEIVHIFCGLLEEGKVKLASG